MFWFFLTFHLSFALHYLEPDHQLAHLESFKICVNVHHYMPRIRNALFQQLIFFFHSIMLKFPFKMISMLCVVSHLFFPHLVMCLTCTLYTHLKYFNLPYALPLTTCHSFDQRVDIVLSKDKICIHALLIAPAYLLL